MSGDNYAQVFSLEWVNRFEKPHFLEILKGSALKGDIKSCLMRSVCWKLFLGCLPEDKDDWVDATRAQRQSYERVMDKYDTNPRNDHSLDVNVNNPLSQSHQSTWNRYFEDNELKTTIQQDVVRTFPDIEFFRKSDVQKVMINILFNYAREFPHVSYKQGMHELLAPILYVIHCDQQRYLSASACGVLFLDVHILLNQNYFEHDAFALFCQLMSRVDAWYTAESPYEDVALSTPESPKEADVMCILSLPDTLKSISRNHLKRIDNDLFCHLEKMEITPQIYGIRWLRLLFGREFSLEDLLVLWDAIFADSKHFLLVDFVFVAMLISIRELLLVNDYAFCLNYLMRFPHVENVQYIIDLALHLREPQKYRRPEGISKKKAAVNRLILKDAKQSGYKSLSKPSGSSVKSQTTSKQNLESRPKSLSIAGVNKLWGNTGASSSSGARPKSSSLSAGNLKREPSSGSISDLCSDFLNLEVSSDLNSGASSSLPCTSIRNVMESRSHKFRASDISQTPAHESNKNILSENAFRELVPLAQPSSKAHVLKENKPLPTDNAEKLRILKQKMANLKEMHNYCTQQLTLHVSKLQFCMMNEKLEREDEMYVALAGIKKARDILKGTIRFHEVVIDDDAGLYSAFAHNVSIHSNSSTEDQQSFDESIEKEESIVKDDKGEKSENVSGSEIATAMDTSDMDAGKGMDAEKSSDTFSP